MLNPNLSALAKASSVVPIFEHFSLNFSKLGSFLKFEQISWSTDIAIKLAPKIVSGLVVNIRSFIHRRDFKI